MSEIREEIELHSDNEDKPVLNWLLDHYSMRSQFFFVATCSSVRYSKQSYAIFHIWKPTKEGYILYENRHKLFPIGS